jgi:ABC-type phosphate/phosphonate transport system permease subunit
VSDADYGRLSVPELLWALLRAALKMGGVAFVLAVMRALTGMLEQ